MNHSFANCAVQALHVKGCEITPLAPTGRRGGAPLPETLVVPPGEYDVFGQKYSLRCEGLYRFFHPTRENRQCIVYEADVPSLMSAVCWMVTHGYRDRGKSFTEKKAIACRGKLVVTCSECSHFAIELLRDLGVPVRLAETWSLRSPNGYNDGHTLTEVQIENCWVAFDPDRSRLYRRKGKRLNLLELTRHDSNAFEEEPLATKTEVAVGHFSAAGYDYDLWYETILADAALSRDALRRVLEIPVLTVQGKKYFTAFSAAQCQRAKDLYGRFEWHYLAPAEFESRFYTASRHSS